MLACFGEWRLLKWVIPLKCRSIFNQWNINLKTKLRGAVASRAKSNPVPSSIAVIDCHRCWLYLCKVTTVLYFIFPTGRAVIGFDHGLPWCVKYRALEPPVATKPSDFTIAFCADRKPSGHVFHTSRQAMIKTYNLIPTKSSRGHHSIGMSFLGHTDLIQLSNDYFQKSIDTYCIYIYMCENVFKTTRPCCYKWFRVSTRQAMLITVHRFKHETHYWRRPSWNALLAAAILKMHFQDGRRQ